MKKLYIYLLAFCCLACSKTELAEFESDYPAQTRAIPTIDFDWEDCDYMPTPPGQTAIPCPWVGAGSIAPEFGMDITNDRYRKDGWELIYNTFDTNASGPLVNPYFILYNKYRGILRVYLYITTQFITTSHSLQDGLQIVSSFQTSILRFLNKSIIDITDNNHSSYFTQVHPYSENESSPVAANKWYMFQYELEYDPALSALSNKQIQMSWFVNYLQISKLEIEGKAVGSISGSIGGGGTSDNMINEFVSTGKSIGTTALATMGINFFDKNRIAKTENITGNKLSIPAGIFETMYSGLSKALSGSMSELPGKIMGIFSSVFGLNSAQKPTLVNLRLETDISLNGTISSKGSLPSMPISFWIPGTNIASNAPGYIPFYNKSLGVVGFKTGSTIPILNTHGDIYQYVEIEPYDRSERPYVMLYLDITVPDYTDYLIINPEVKNIADVIITQRVFMDNKLEVTSGRYCLGEFSNQPPAGMLTGYPVNRWNPDWTVQFSIEVKPKNGDNPSIIVKTMKLQEKRRETWHDVVFIG
ncbi:MAG: hypothetical protein NC226_03350 [Bacteroides cellulosilyticus]|nr:hypothetical protein [Bacteroides cellulosilyticus]